MVPSVRRLRKAFDRTHAAARGCIWRQVPRPGVSECPFGLELAVPRRSSMASQRGIDYHRIMVPVLLPDGAPHSRRDAGNCNPARRPLAFGQIPEQRYAASVGVWERTSLAGNARQGQRFCTGARHLVLGLRSGELRAPQSVSTLRARGHSGAPPRARGRMPFN